MRANVDITDASEILRTAPPDQPFLFFEDIGKYTGRMATSLDDFCEIIKTIDVKSLTFHFRRGDYERWIRESLRDVQLARRLNRVKKSNSAEELRNRILQVAKSRLEELRGKKVRKIKSPYRKEKPKKSKSRKKKTIRKKTKPKTAKTRRKRRENKARL